MHVSFLSMASFRCWSSDDSRAQLQFRHRSIHAGGAALKNDCFVLAFSLWSRLRGLLGARSRWEDGAVLVLVPCKSIHTWWMRYSIDIAFIDKNGVVLFAERDVGPWRVMSNRDACFVFERPSCQGSPWFEAGDAVPLRPYGHSRDRGLMN